jgi:hypothetical protein
LNSWRLNLYPLGVSYIGTIRVDLTTYLDSGASTLKNLKVGGKGSYSIPAEIQVEFGNESGLLQFKALIKGEEAGKVHIRFD